MEWIKMPLGTEIGTGPDDIVLALPMERGTVRLRSFRHISISGLGVGASRASFIAFLQSLAPDIASFDRYGRV